jgi:NADH dehydrogenase FAD-containing subunit
MANPAWLNKGEEMSTRVVVVGGGYGGAATAKALDDVADVVLIEPRDAFVHNIAALRGLVDPQWTDRVFYPYDGLLDRGTWIRDRAVRVDADGVTVGSGDRIQADYIVLATGSDYPFPAKLDVDDSTTGKAKLEETRVEMLEAERVLVLGAGPVGLELAGEIKSAWPDKAVTLVDPIDGIMPSYDEELRTELQRQLDELGIELVLGTALNDEPSTQPGVSKTFTVTTGSGREITADIWFRCFGVVPNTGYLADGLSAARQPDGYLEVTPELRLAGRENVFAIGDVTAVPEPKRGGSAGRHAEVVAGNIRKLIEGEAELETYEPPPPLILLPLGPTGGVAQLPGVGVTGAETTSQYKGQDLFSGRYEELFGLK